MFSRFSKLDIATSNFQNEFYNGGYVQEVSVAMLKEIIQFEIMSLKRENQKKSLQKIDIKTKYEIFLQ